MPAKALRGQKLADELLRVAKIFEGKYRQAFLRSVINVVRDQNLIALINDIESGKFTYGDSIDARLASVAIGVKEMETLTSKAMVSSAKITNQVMSIEGSFNVVNDAFIEAAKNLSMNLSTSISNSARQSLRGVIEELVSGAIPKSEALRRIMLEVGLLPTHAIAVRNYRATLLGSGTPMPKVKTLTEAYTKRLLKYRADMIARTEVARSIGIGQTEFWKQMQAQGFLPPDANRVWITSIDEKTCEFCGPMNGLVASIGGGWQTSKGYLEYPQASHPHCRCSAGITMSKPKKSQAIYKLEELEWQNWLIGKGESAGHPFRGNQYTQGISSGIKWDNLYGDRATGLPDIREELEGYLTPQALQSIESWVNDSKWPKPYLSEVTSEDYSDHYDVLQSRLLHANFPEMVIIIRMGTQNSNGNIRSGSAIKSWNGGNPSGVHYGKDTKIFVSIVPRKNIIGVGSLEEGEFFYTTEGVITSEITKGESAGHPFRGNQYIRGVSGESSKIGPENVEMQFATPFANLNRRYGIKQDWQATVAIEPEKRVRTSKAYEDMPLLNLTPAVKASWDSAEFEIRKQFKQLTEKDGVKIKFVDEDPYTSFLDMHRSVSRTGVLKILKTSSTGGHPYWSNQTNDMFRAVHDAYGHLGVGRGFDRHGEEAAFQAHKSMFPESAHAALATELRAQNQFMIHNRYFGPQKVGFLPIELQKLWRYIIKKISVGTSDVVITSDEENMYALGGTHHASNGRNFVITKGEAAGHPFRGNQWTRGISGGGKPQSAPDTVASEFLRHSGYDVLPKPTSDLGVAKITGAPISWLMPESLHPTLVPLFAELRASRNTMSLELKGAFEDALENLGFTSEEVERVALAFEIRANLLVHNGGEKGGNSIFDRSEPQTPDQKSVGDSEAQVTITDDSVPAIMMYGGAFHRLINEGRYKTQFETNTSGGVNNTKLRAAQETAMFSLHPSVTPKKRPVYGFVFDGGTKVDISTQRDLGQYGSIVVVLKPQVRSRTSWTEGDSLNQTMLVSRMDNPTYHGVVEYSGALSWSPIIYKEAQIHGGVTRKDIDYVVMPRYFISGGVEEEYTDKREFAQMYDIPISQVKTWKEAFSG